MARDLFASVTPKIRNILEQIIGSALVNRTITWKLYQGDSFDSGAGYPVSQFTEYTGINAARTVHNTKSAKAVGGEVEVGDAMYLVRNEELPDGISMKDEIVDTDDSVTLKISNIQWVFSFGAVFSCKRK